MTYVITIEISLTRLFGQKYSEKKISSNSVIKFQYNYCVLGWMFFSRTWSIMINKSHEIALRTTINNYFDEFNTFLENLDDICNHHGNIQTDLTVVFKMNNELALSKVESVLNMKINTCNVSKFHKLVTGRKRTVWYGPGTLSYWFNQL